MENTDRYCNNRTSVGLGDQSYDVQPNNVRRNHVYRLQRVSIWIDLREMLAVEKI